MSLSKRLWRALALVCTMACALVSQASAQSFNPNGSTISSDAAQIFRLYVSPNVPSSGPNNPDKSQIQQLFAVVGGVIVELQGTAAAAGSFGYPTQAALYADLAHPAFTQATVWADSTASLDGIYIKNGASGSGAWNKVSNSPFGLLPTWTVGTVTTVSYGTGASVSVTGTAEAPIINFSIPSGPPVTSFPLSSLTGLGTNVATALADALNGTGALAGTTGPVFNGVGVASTYAYSYNGVVAIQAVTASSDWFLAGAGNLTLTGTSNIGVGVGALSADTTGINNCGIGTHALISNTTGNDNCAIGTGSLFANISGSFNVAIGFSSQVAATTGTLNVGVGVSTLFSNGIGGQDTAVGTESLISYVGTGATDSNTALGYLSGGSLVTGINNLILGANCAGNATMSDAILLCTGEGTLRADFGVSLASAWNFGAKISIDPSGATQFDVHTRNNSGVTGQPVAYFQPTTANTAMALDVTPKGTVSTNALGAGIAWIDVVDADLDANPSATFHDIRAAVRTDRIALGSECSGTCLPLTVYAPAIDFAETATSTPFANFNGTTGVLTLTALAFASLPSGTPATYACFTAGGALVSSGSAC